MSKKEVALGYFDKGFSCAQSVFVAYAEELGLDRDMALKIAGGFGGGMGRKAETCGAVSGALMAIGLKCGAINADDQESKEKTYALVREFIDRFEAQHGSIVCKELLDWDISTPAGHEVAKYKQLFSTLCPNYVESAAEIVEKILAEQDRNEDQAF